MSSARQLAPLAALTAAFCAHLGFFNPYLPLWLKDQGLGLAAISLMVSLQAVTRLVAPYGWGWLSDHTGRRVLLLRYAASAALVASLGLWVPGGQGWLFAVLLLLYAHMSAIMPLGEAALADRVSREGGFDARRYGRVRVFGSAGFLLSVLAAGWWFERRGLHEFPAWSQVTLGLMLLAAFWLPTSASRCRQWPVATCAT